MSESESGKLTIDLSPTTRCHCLGHHSPSVRFCLGSFSFFSCHHLTRLSFRVHHSAWPFVWRTNLAWSTIDQKQGRGQHAIFSLFVTVIVILTLWIERVPCLSILQRCLTDLCMLVSIIRLSLPRISSLTCDLGILSIVCITSAKERSNQWSAILMKWKMLQKLHSVLMKDVADLHSDAK